MRELVVSEPEPGRVLLGRLSADTTEAMLWGLVDAERSNPALASPPGYGVMVVGASRSGKTTSILSPSVVRWDGPVIATSIRSDVLRNSWEAREEAGWPVLIYNPKNQGGFGSNTWSPLVAAMGDKPWPGARRMATALIEASGIVENGANQSQDFWNAAAADYLAPVLLAAAVDGPSMEPVLRWLQKGDKARVEIRRQLSDHPEALSAAEAVWKLVPKQRDSIYLTARTALSAYQDDDVMSTCRSDGPLPDITPDSVLGSTGDNATPGATLYVISPPTDWRYFAPLFTALLTSLIDAAYNRAEQETSLDPPLLLALDEVANIAPIHDLPSIVSTAAGAGIQVVTGFQDLAQAERIWGVDGARTLLQNHYARLILGGTADLATLEWAQAMLGEVESERITQSTEGTFGRRTTSRSSERMPVATAAELRTMPRGTALLICGSFPAARVTLRQWTTI
jgi:type IV secretory pathway TraG/TraD family ATPase VirD4